jgi:hypothetical protein
MQVGKTYTYRFRHGSLAFKATSLTAKGNMVCEWQDRGTVNETIVDATEWDNYVEVKTKKKLWVNVYRGNGDIYNLGPTHSTEDAAKAYTSYVDYLTTVPIEFEV